MTPSAFNKQLVHLLAFLAVIVVVSASLKLVNWIPGAVDPGLMKRYASIEDAQAALGIRRILVPTYYPEALGWPPAEVLAQSQPFRAIVMNFHRAGNRQTVLVIAQAERASFRPDRIIRFLNVNETVQIQLRGRPAMLEAGLCDDGSACSRINWNEESLHVELTMRAPSPELIRIAESMSN